MSNHSVYVPKLIEVTGGLPGGLQISNTSVGLPKAHGAVG